MEIRYAPFAPHRSMRELTSALCGERAQRQCPLTARLRRSRSRPARSAHVAPRRSIVYNECPLRYFDRPQADIPPSARDFHSERLFGAQDGRLAYYFGTSEADVPATRRIDCRPQERAQFCRSVDDCRILKAAVQTSGPIGAATANRSSLRYSLGADARFETALMGPGKATKPRPTSQHLG